MELLLDVGERTGVDLAGWNPSSRLGFTIAAAVAIDGGAATTACSAGLLIDAFAKTLFGGGGDDASDAELVDLLDALPLDVERCLPLSFSRTVCSANGDVAL